MGIFMIRFRKHIKTINFSTQLPYLTSMVYIEYYLLSCDFCEVLAPLVFTSGLF